MSHRKPDLTFRGLGTPTDNRRVIAVGRCVNGSTFHVTTPPADWPSEAEIEAICAPNKYDLMAKAIRALIDDGDWAIYTMFAGIAERQEERRAP